MNKTGIDFNEDRDKVTDFNQTFMIKKDTSNFKEFGKTMGMRSTQRTLKDSGTLKDTSSFGISKQTLKQTATKGSDIFRRGRNSH